MSGSNSPKAAPGSGEAQAREAEEQKVFLKSGGAGAPQDNQPQLADRQDALREALSAVNNALEAEEAEAAAAVGEPAVVEASALTSPGVAAPASDTGTSAADASVADASVKEQQPMPVAPAPKAPEETDQRGGPTGMTGPKTQIVRGPRRPTRTDFHQEPVVAWLVVIGGPGLGAFRPLFTGNNTIGRATANRVPVDFGDDSISSQEQAYIRYDAADREFLFVPNLSKTNVVSVNEQKPTSAVRLQPMDVITMGQTQLVFVPFCGEDFDWSELADLES